MSRATWRNDAPPSQVMGNWQTSEYPTSLTNRVVGGTGDVPRHTVRCKSSRTPHAPSRASTASSCGWRRRGDSSREEYRPASTHRAPSRKEDPIFPSGPRIQSRQMTAVGRNRRATTAPQARSESSLTQYKYGGVNGGFHKDTASVLFATRDNCNGRHVNNGLGLTPSAFEHREGVKDMNGVEMSATHFWQPQTKLEHGVAPDLDTYKPRRITEPPNIFGALATRQMNKRATRRSH